jgi:hypothetical protein
MAAGAVWENAGKAAARKSAARKNFERITRLHQTAGRPEEADPFLEEVYICSSGLQGKDSSNSYS